MIVLMAGLPGTGKSTVARALAERIGGIVLNKDVIRAALFGPSHVEYSTAQDDFCQHIMLQTAAYLLDRHPTLPVLLDGRTFSRQYQRHLVSAFAVQRQIALAVIECVCREETALARLARDIQAGAHPAQNRTPDLYRALRASFEPVPPPKLVLDTDRDFTESLQTATLYLEERQTIGSAGR